MSETIAISNENIIHHLKLSRQMPTIIQDIANRNIIDRTAEELHITVETEELQRAANDFRLKYELLSSQATRSWLQKYYLSIDDFEEFLYADLLGYKLAQHLLGDRIEAYYVENQLDYFQVNFYEVILNDLDIAMELFYALQEEEISFAEVAHQHIHDDLELRRRGGYKGSRSRKELKPEIAAAVFAANPPQILKPIVVGKRVHLIKVEEIIQPQLDEPLRSKILDRLFADWLKQKRTEIDIAIV